MTISNFKYFPFSLRLNNPFQTSSQKIEDRNGFIISLSDESGNNALGECSPLPGFSTENIEDAERILKGLNHQIIGFSAEDNIDSIDDLLSDFHLVPSLRFALEQALIGLIIKRYNNFFEDTFPVFKKEFNVNSVIGFNEEEIILNQINDKIRKGFSTFKIKAGRENFNLDLKLLEAIRTAFGCSIKLRMDTNGKWDFEKAKKYFDELSRFDIEFIEEPCGNLEENLLLAESSAIPVALDESISSPEDAHKIIEEGAVKFIILKPAIKSGIVSSLKIIREAARKEIKVIISSSFESAVGKTALVLLASSIDHSFAQGLDTADFFTENICTDPFGVRNGKIQFDRNNYPPQLNFSMQ